MLDPVIPWIVSLGMTVLFATAAWHKLASPSKFLVILAEYQILPTPIVGVVAFVIPTVEAGLAVFWLMQLFPMITAGLSILLLGVYCLAIGINLMRGRVYISCGCGFSGSEEDQPLSAGLIIRNSVLILILIISLMPENGRELMWIDSVAILFSTMLCILFYGSISQLLRNGASMASWRS